MDCISNEAGGQGGQGAQDSKFADEQSTQLAHITDNFDDPITLFKKWLEEAEKNDNTGMARAMNIATVHGQFGVLNRIVMLLEFDESGFAFVTERNSRKYKDMIRVNGKVSELSPDEIKKFYAEEPLFAKIRCKICVCGEPCDWNDLKRKHDEVLDNFQKGTEKLEQNEIYTALKIQPEVVDFYFAVENSIADIIRYTKDVMGKWSHEHVCA